MERVTHKFAREHGSNSRIVTFAEGERFLNFYRTRWQVGVSIPPMFEGLLSVSLHATFFDVTFFGDSKGGLSADMQAEEFAREMGYIKITQ